MGTITEIYDYLRVLYARIGRALLSPRCGPRDVRLARLPSRSPIGDRRASAPGPVSSSWLRLVGARARASTGAPLDKARRSGSPESAVDGRRSISLENDLDLEKKNKKHDIEIVVDRLIAKPELLESSSSRLTDSVETALRWLEGRSDRPHRDGEEDLLLLQPSRLAITGGLSFPELHASGLFSFNSPQGGCVRTCHGAWYQGRDGARTSSIPRPDVERSTRGAVKPWGVVEDKGGWRAAVVRSLARPLHSSTWICAWKRMSKRRTGTSSSTEAARKKQITVRKGRRSFKPRASKA